MPKVTVLEAANESEKVSGSDIIDAILESLRAGQTIVMTKINDQQWSAYVTDSIPTVRTMEPKVIRHKLGSDYHGEMHNPDYWPFTELWNSMSAEEKIAYAVKLGVEWDTHSDPKINNMRATQAVRAFKKIKKWKSKYDDKTIRAKSADRYKKGLPWKLDDKGNWTI